MDREIELTLDNGETVTANVIFTFEENGDDFILYEYADNAFAAKVLPDGQLRTLADDEWELIKRIYEEYQNENEEEE